MKSKNNINKIQSKDIEVIPKTPGNKKPNVNVNTYMKKSKRNSNKENNVDIISDVVIPEVVIPDIKQDIIPEFNITSDIVTNIKALNLIKAREARKINIQNKTQVEKKRY